MAVSIGTLDYAISMRPASQVKAEALREAADALYSDTGPDHPLSVATWLRERADEIERSKDRR